MQSEQTGAAPLPEALKTRLAAAVMSLGLTTAIERLGLPSRAGVTAALAGLPIRRGTAALIEQGLERWTGPKTPDDGADPPVIIGSGGAT